MRNVIQLARPVAFGVAFALALGIGNDAASRVLGLQNTAFAQASSGDRSADRKKRRRVPNITESTFRRLSDAQELVDAALAAHDVGGAAAAAPLWREAMDFLDSMVERSRRYNGNERGQVHNMLAYVNYELDDIEQTLYHYEQVLAQVPDISEVVENTTLQQLSKLYFQEGNRYEGDAALPWYRKSLDMMEAWLVRNENPGPEAHFYVAQIYYQMKDFANAIARLELVVALAQQREMKVKEHWWTMLQYLYFEQENWPKVIGILEILVKDYPKRAYWVNLASVYGEIGSARKAALDVGGCARRRFS